MQGYAQLKTDAATTGRVTRTFTTNVATVRELSNNLAENSMRPVAVGRKNWIHVGSTWAGPKVAAILSVVESCRRLKISIRDYLNAVLPGLANLPVSRIPGLTPSAWARQH